MLQAAATHRAGHMRTGCMRALFHDQITEFTYMLLKMIWLPQWQPIKNELLLNLCPSHTEIFSKRRKIYTM